MALAEGNRRRHGRDYVEALEEERRKIQMFSRELPLCLQLVTEAIESCRRRMAGEVPVLEEFIPLRPSFSSSENGDRKGVSNSKPDWLRSVQLWGPAAVEEPPTEGGGTLRKPVAVNARKVGGAFQPFEREKITPFAPGLSPAAAISSTTTAPGSIGDKMNGCGEEKEKEDGRSQPPPPPHRKHRRCWSPGLHRKFLHALEQLGGSQAATPKQIRELMKVDGLTNDEVKSHLQQKFRLHTRRPVTTVQSSSSSSSPQTPPQFVVVGGIWVPPPDYVAAVTAAAAVTASAAPALPPKGSSPAADNQHSPVPLQAFQLGLVKEPFNSPKSTIKDHDNDDEDSLADDAATKSNSSTTSSSSQTTTASPPL
ncbi:Putative Myb family transcription factor [Apostasia shenzhenica]|uniref:Myb family transcription factor n=1 Tax=Apostasia shenzhenica TaxID=1088818 RepID=A0A2I0B9N7_9ASPA|nr:Putative Myb family transcription factor [Apostasia shenzhenica]